MAGQLEVRVGGDSLWLQEVNQRVHRDTATTLGETGGDMLSMTLNVGYAVSSIILLSLFIPVVTAQLFAKRYHPLLYWSVILATSTSASLSALSWLRLLMLAR